MKRSHFRISLVVLLIGLADVLPARAQEPSRFEIGALFSALRLGDLNDVNAGVGGRFSYDLSTWIAADAEFNFVPQDSATVTGRAPGSPEFRLIYQRRRADALFGVKSGWRGDRVGIFAKVRPGLTRLSHKGVDCGGDMCALILLALPTYRTEFALDFGGVVEFYPSARTVARLDVGDFMIRQSNSAPPCQECVTHNFSSRVGIGWRF